MIICNSCGTPLGDGLSFCSECGAPAGQRADHSRLRATNAVTQALNIPQAEESAVGNPKWNLPRRAMLALGGAVTAVLIIIVVFAVRSSFFSKSAEASASLRKAVQSGQLVTSPGDDAYSYFLQLRNLDPLHPALSELKSQVLPQLRSTGEEVFRKRVSLSLEIVTDREWSVAQRAYEWAHTLEPGDKGIEAKQLYASAHIARLQGRREEAKNNLFAASRLDPAWEVIQNDLGYLHALDKNYSAALPLYQSAINLNDGWDIPYNNMGTAYYYLRNYDNAEAWYRRAAEINPQWATPRAWLGTIYENRRAYEAAIQEFQSAISLYNPSRDRINTADLQSRITNLQNKIVP